MADPKDVKLEAGSSPAENEEGKPKVSPKHEESVSYERFKELSDTLKVLKEQNDTLTESVRELKAPPPTEESKDEDMQFEYGADPNIQKLHEKQKGLSVAVDKMVQAVGGIANAQDRIDTLSNPNVDKKDYLRLEPEIEKQRVEIARTQGRLLTRRELYVFLGGKKPDPEKAETTDGTPKEEPAAAATPPTETQETAPAAAVTPKDATEMRNKRLKDVEF